MKYAIELVVISSIYIFIKSPDSLLYIRNNSIYFLIAEVQTKIKINLRFLFYFDLVICLDSNITLVIILFKDRPKPIKKPFLSKLYMLSAVIRYFLIIIAS
jgi:hypothetical protein